MFRPRVVVRVATSSRRPDGRLSPLSKTMKMCHVTDFILRRSMRASTTVGSALARATGGRASPRANSSGPLARASSTGAEIAKGDGFVVPEGCQLAVFASG